MEILLRVAINIQEGESLSINTNPGHLDFARDLAQLAAETTLQPVNVVVVTEGKPGDVLEVKPILNELLSKPAIQGALLRIDDTEDRQWDFSADPQVVVKEPALLQRTGNLAPPQLDRQVAPWSIVPVPGPVWARRLLGEHATEQDLYERLADVLMLNQTDPQQAWKEHVSLIDYRLATLNRLDVDYYEIRSGTGTSVRISPVVESRWRGGVRKLGTGRAFIPQLPPDRVSMLADRTFTEGVVHASRPFPLLGGVVKGAKIEFTQGAVSSFSADAGEELLAAALQVDEGINRLSEFSLVEHGSTLSQLADTFGYKGFDENSMSSLVLGMGEAFHLEALDMYTDEMELQDKTGCNVSNLRFRLPIGDENLSVIAYLVDGSNTTIMQNGKFLT